MAVTLGAWKIADRCASIGPLCRWCVAFAAASLVLSCVHSYDRQLMAPDPVGFSAHTPERRAALFVNSAPASAPLPERPEPAPASPAATPEPARPPEPPGAAEQAIPPLPPGETDPTSPAVAAADAALAEFLYRVVSETEAADPRLAAADAQLRQIDHEINAIGMSNGWEFVIRRRRTETDGFRHDKRLGWTRRLDIDPDTGLQRLRNPYDLSGDLLRGEKEFMTSLQRSFLGSDHEKYVDMALRRLDKIDAAIKKQNLRREIHLATLQSILGALHSKMLLHSLDEQLALAKAQVQVLRQYQNVGEALLKDVQAAELQVQTIEQQRQISRNTIEVALFELRSKTGDPTLDLPGTLPLTAGIDPPPTIDRDAASSYALDGRIDYYLAQMRLRLMDRLVMFGAWYLPKVSLDIWWSRFRSHQQWLDEFRHDMGRERGIEWQVNIPLNLGVRGVERNRAFAAARDAYRLEREQMGRDIQIRVLHALVAWQQAALRRTVARRGLEQALEDQRETELVAEKMPESLKGIGQVEVLDRRLAVAEARAKLYEAEYLLLLAELQWEYVTGDSPIDDAVAPFEERDKQAFRKSWSQWLMSLMVLS
jgi:hypothetical protein